MKTLRVLTAATVLTFAIAFAPVAAQADGPRGRLENQHDRIEQGIRSGELTRHEASVVRTDDRLIRTEVRFDRLTDHGHLTSTERCSLNNQLNRNSERIYDLEHNCNRR